MALPLITIDSADAPNCKALVIALQNAYLQLLAGDKRVRVRYAERWTEYEPGKEQGLLNQINTIMSQCPDTEGLLSMNRGHRTTRGRPARFFGV